MQQNEKYSLLLNLQADERLNAEIDKIVKARATEIVRSMVNNEIDEYIKRMVTEIVAAKLSKLSDIEIRQMVRQVIQNSLYEAKINQVVSDVLVERFNERDWLDMVERCARNHVNMYSAAKINEILKGVVQADVINAISEALLKRD